MTLIFSISAVQAAPKKVCIDGLGKLSYKLIPDELYSAKHSKLQEGIEARFKAQQVEVDGKTLKLLADFVLYQSQHGSFALIPIGFTMQKQHAEAFREELKQRKLIASYAVKSPQNPELVTLTVPFNSTEISLLGKLKQLNVKAIKIETVIYDSSTPPPVFAILKHLNNKSSKAVRDQINQLSKGKIEGDKLRLSLEINGQFFKEFVNQALGSRIATVDFVEAVKESKVEIVLTKENYYLVLLRILTSPVVKTINLSDLLL
ncbi:MAG: hypothetical protein IPM57_07855 [Oligoflexia bacterium]|nr:hypothetical protein [Oligoflexia bacterium]